MTELSAFLREFGVLTLIVVGLLYMLLRTLMANNKKVDSISDRIEVETKKEDTISTLATSAYNELLKMSNSSMQLVRELGEQGKVTAVLQERMLTFDVQLRSLESELERTRKARAADVLELTQLKDQVSNYSKEKTQLAVEKTALSEELKLIKQENTDLKHQVDTLTLRVAAQQVEIESIRQGAQPAVSLVEVSFAAAKEATS